MQQTAIASPVSVTSAQRHPTYYFEDGTIVILLSASNMLYRLHRSYLILDSGCFQTMLSLRPEDVREGITDGNPVAIPDITAQDFDRFLDFQLRHILPVDDEDALTAILNLGRFFQYETAQREARAALEQLSSFGPVARYVLGLRNSIKEWAAGGFRELVAPTINRKFTFAEVERMGIGPYHMVMDTRTTIETHRRSIAYSIPSIQHAATCPFNLECEFGWKREWKAKVARHLMHPDEALPGREVLSLLESVDINDVHGQCKDGTVQRIRETAVLTYEEVIVERAIQALV